MENLTGAASHGRKMQNGKGRALEASTVQYCVYFEEPWKGSVLEVYHIRTTDGSDLRVMDPNIDISNID